MLNEQILKTDGEQSNEFNDFVYWCISDNKRAAFARARQDVPYTQILENLTTKELSVAKKLIRERLKSTDEIFYVKLVGFCGDIYSIDIIEKKLNNYMQASKKERRDYVYCIKLCEDVLNELKSIKENHQSDQSGDGSRDNQGTVL